MTDRTPNRWRETDWRGHRNFVCTVGGCLFATLDIGEMRRHADEKHPLPSQRGPEDHPLAGVPFASDAATKAALAAGITARALAQITPSGRTGGYTLADVRSAAKLTTT